MADYIDRQAAINALIEELAHRPDGYWDSGLKQYDVEVVLNQQPSIDAVEVVRCGECKYMMSNGACYEFADPYANLSASDFCSRGERKDEQPK